MNNTEARVNGVNGFFKSGEQIQGNVSVKYRLGKSERYCLKYICSVQQIIEW